MAYQITCDNPACGAVVASADAGRPALVARRHVYCVPCGAIVEQVEQALRDWSQREALTLAAGVEERRRQLMREMMPPQRGGAPAGERAGVTAPVVGTIQ